MCNPGHIKTGTRKIIIFSPLTPIHTFRSHRSHELYRKRRDFATLWAAIVLTSTRRLGFLYFRRGSSEGNPQSVQGDFLRSEGPNLWNSQELRLFEGTNTRVAKSRPFRWSPRDLWDRKMWMGFNGEKVITFWPQSLYAPDYTYVDCGFKW